MIPKKSILPFFLPINFLFLYYPFTICWYQSMIKEITMPTKENFKVSSSSQIRFISFYWLCMKNSHRQKTRVFWDFLFTKVNFPSFFMGTIRDENAIKIIRLYIYETGPFFLVQNYKWYSFIVRIKRYIQQVKNT